MSSETIRVEVPIEEALNGDSREESNLTDEEIEPFVDLTRDIERSRALREVARDRLDDDDLPEAESLLWVDEAEVYELCPDCYAENRGGAWTGFTEHPNHGELRDTMNDRLKDGVPCSFCKSDRLDELVQELRDEVDVEVVIVE